VPSRHWQRLYAALLRLYPPRYRQLFATEMTQLFTDLLIQERARRGRLGMAVIAARSYLDLPRSALFVRRHWARKQPHRRSRKAHTMDTIVQDIRYALRAFRRNPGFTTITIVTLALGIGANTAIFSVVNGVLFRPLPFEAPEELVLVWNELGNAGGSRSGISGRDLIDFREQSERFTDFAGTWALGTNLSGDDQPEQVTMAWVSTNFFSVLGVEAALGRMFLPEDKTNTDLSLLTDPNFTPPPGAMVLSHGLWQQSFGGDPDILGRTIRANGQSLHVIGVAPAGFRLFLPVDAPIPADADAWILFPIDMRQASRGQNNLTVIGRMKPDVTVAQGQLELDDISTYLRDNFPIHERLGTQMRSASMHGEAVGHVQPVLFVLLGAVGFVLAIACANVANLMLVRTSTRDREFAIRGAMGGSRGRIMRQVLTESALLAVLGAGLGIVLATWGIDLLLALRPENLPRVESVGIDANVLGFTLGASLLAAFLFGLGPAMQSTRTQLAQALKDRGSASDGPRRNRLRGTLVIGEMALSLVLLIGAGLLLRSFVMLSKVEPGFSSERVLTANFSLPFFSYREWDKRTGFFRELTERMAAIPGIESVGGVTPLPLSGEARTGHFTLDESDVEQWTRNEADYRPIMPGYFETMQTSMLSGRRFSAADNQTGAPSVAIVDETFAAQVWPDDDPIGQRLVIQVPNRTQTGAQTAWAEVVGVVQHVRHTDLSQDSRPTLYLPYETDGWFELSLVAKTSVEPLSVVDAIRREVQAIDADLPMFAVRTMDDYVADAMAPTRFALVLIAVFAGVAMVLASVGLYGVISYIVRQRTREIGVRIAFGAEGRNIMRLLLGKGLALAAAGVGIGLVAAYGLTRVMENMLFGVSASDPTTFAGIATLLVAVAALACYVPARRAMRVDPMMALREE
jgi:putative ABC transport system permease protein